jgi:hypothetical protein
MAALKNEAAGAAEHGAEKPPASRAQGRRAAAISLVSVIVIAIGAMELPRIVASHKTASSSSSGSSSTMISHTTTPGADPLRQGCQDYFAAFTTLVNTAGNAGNTTEVTATANRVFAKELRRISGETGGTYTPLAVALRKLADDHDQYALLLDANGNTASSAMTAAVDNNRNDTNAVVDICQKKPAG